MRAQGFWIGLDPNMVTTTWILDCE